MSKPTGPACGNNPNYPMSDGDRQAVADFKAYLADRAALRDRIAAALLARIKQATVSRTQPHNAFTSLLAANEYDLADAVLAVLPPPADRAAVERIRAVLETEAVVGRTALEYRGLITSALMADEARQQPDTETEAHPPEHSWAAELHDPLADEWVPGTRYIARDRALNALAHAQRLGPTWKDGTPTQRRLVRATTTYTVERPASGPGVADEEQPETPVHVGGNAEDCPACAGTNPPYPFICPGPDPAETEA